MRPHNERTVSSFTTRWDIVTDTFRHGQGFTGYVL
jgi:hypothetical protein